MQRTATRRALTRFVVALTLIALVAGCRHYAIRRRIADAEYPPRPPNYPIQLTPYDFQEPYLEIAQVETRGYDDRLIETAGSAELRQAARDLGGDAVIKVSRDGVVQEEFVYRPGELIRRGTRFVNRYTLNGLVIRFLRGAESHQAMPPPVAGPGDNPANPQPAP